MTEARSPYTDLDARSTREILEIINQEDARVPEAVRREIPKIEQAVEMIVEAFSQGGRLFYVGAGTSGRLGVLDASECPPTFGVPPEQVQGIIAGGDGALRRSSEETEDSRQDGEKDVAQAGVGPRDVVVGIAASGRTPYVLGALAEARRRGARTVGLVCNPDSELDDHADVVIAPVVGPEVLMGSTRMKAGTAQKLVLNMLSTTAMIRSGKVYSNLMVDLQATNEKLRVRALRIIHMATGCSPGEAERAFQEAGGRVKPAIVMILAGCSAAEANALLEEAGGFVRLALERAAPRRGGTETTPS